MEEDGTASGRGDMNWRMEAVLKETLAGASVLASCQWLSDFYLAGGTALALQYGHRMSADLDFFSSNNLLLASDRRMILKDLAPHKVFVEEEKDATLHLRLLKTHVSFFNYQYPLMKPLRTWQGISVADPIDIGLMKIGAIMGRGSKKDFFDLREILLREMELTKLLKLSKKKFKLSLDFPLQACRAMVFFDQAESEPPPRMLAKTSWAETKLFFQREVKRSVKLLF